MAVTVIYLGPPVLSLRMSAPSTLTAKRVVRRFVRAYEAKHQTALDPRRLALSRGADGADLLAPETRVADETVFVVEAEEARHVVGSARLVAGGRGIRLLGKGEARVCFLGGSITEQRLGWRPRVAEWLQGRLEGVTFYDAFCGNAGSTLLAFLVREKVIRHAPDLVFIEVAVNDGDAILEASGDATGTMRALEGIVRSIKSEVPSCAVVFVEMFLRDDLDSSRRSGTKAWVDAAAEASRVYSTDVVAAHAAVARHYACDQIDLNPVFAPKSARDRDALFRDDAHHTPAGAAVAADAVVRCLDRLLGIAHGAASSSCHLLPDPLDAACWNVTSPAHKVDPSSDVRRRPQNLGLPPAWLERCPMTGAAGAPWTWLHPGDEARLVFRGRGLGLVTYVGPDTGSIRVSVAGRTFDRDLVDEWAYYWRTTVVMLVDDLDPTVQQHTAVVAALPNKPDRARLKRPITDPNYLHGDPVLRLTPKLWLLWYVAVS